MLRQAESTKLMRMRIRWIKGVALNHFLKLSPIVVHIIEH